MSEEKCKNCEFFKSIGYAFVREYFGHVCVMPMVNKIDFPEVTKLLLVQGDDRCECFSKRVIPEPNNTSKTLKLETVP